MVDLSFVEREIARYSCDFNPRTRHQHKIAARMNSVASHPRSFGLPQFSSAYTHVSLRDAHKAIHVVGFTPEDVHLVMTRSFELRRVPQGHVSRITHYATRSALEVDSERLSQAHRLFAREFKVSPILHVVSFIPGGSYKHHILPEPLDWREVHSGPYGPSSQQFASAW